MNNKRPIIIYFIILSSIVLIIGWGMFEYFSRTLLQKIKPLEQKLDSVSSISDSQDHSATKMSTEEKISENIISDAPIVQPNPTETNEECSQKLQLIIATYKLLLAIDSGQFYQELSKVKNLTTHNINLQNKLNIINKYSDRGIYTLTTLRENFDILSKQILLQNNNNNENEDYVDNPSRIMKFIDRLVVIQKTESANIIAQTEQLLIKAKLAIAAGNIEEGVKLVNQVPENYFALTQDWLENAQRFLIVHNTARQMYDELMLDQEM